MKRVLLCTKPMQVIRFPPGSMHVPELTVRASWYVVFEYVHMRNLSALQNLDLKADLEV